MLVFFALGNAKVLSFALADAKVPNASSFASQWNIGFKVDLMLSKILSLYLRYIIFIEVLQSLILK